MGGATDATALRGRGAAREAGRRPPAGARAPSATEHARSLGAERRRSLTSAVPSVAVSVARASRSESRQGVGLVPRVRVLGYVTQKNLFIYKLNI